MYMVNLNIVWKDTLGIEVKNIIVSNIVWANTNDDITGHWNREQPELTARFLHTHQHYGLSNTHLSIQYIAFEKHMQIGLCHNDEYILLHLIIDSDGDLFVRVLSKSADGMYRERYYDEVEFDENMLIEFETEQIVEYFDNTIVGFTRNL